MDGLSKEENDRIAEAERNLLNEQRYRKVCPHEPCPACGAAEYEANDGDDPEAPIRCSECGHVPEFTYEDQIQDGLCGDDPDPQLEPEPDNTRYGFETSQDYEDSMPEMAYRRTADELADELAHPVQVKIHQGYDGKGWLDVEDECNLPGMPANASIWEVLQAIDPNVKARVSVARGDEYDSYWIGIAIGTVGQFINRMGPFREQWYDELRRFLIEDHDRKSHDWAKEGF